MHFDAVSVFASASFLLQGFPSFPLLVELNTRIVTRLTSRVDELPNCALGLHTRAGTRLEALVIRLAFVGKVSEEAEVCNEVLRSSFTWRKMTRVSSLSRSFSPFRLCS